MRDFDFKALAHIAENFTILHTGQQLDKGYKPDVVLKNGNDFIIMECDTGTLRKGFIGAMVKAAKFLTGERTGILVLVIKEKPNTTVDQIHRHLQPYFDWILPLTNLKAVYLISTDQYCIDDAPLKLLGEGFITCSKVISRDSGLRKNDE